jgi:hypothetical protein
VRAAIASFALALVLVAAPRIAFAQADAPDAVSTDSNPTLSIVGPSVEHRDNTPLGDAAAFADPALLSQQAGTPRATAFEYSDAYALRRKIHVYASLATGPLFVTQYILGDKLYDGNASESVRSAHSAVAVGILGLFGVNTATGVWNLVEARKDPNGRKRRWIHGLSMLGADVGFVATGLTAPDDDEGEEGRGSRATHRNIAITSVSIATASYLYMLFTR